VSLRDRRKRQDRFYRRAKREGYAARSVFKLEQLDERFGLLRAGQRVLDLGCRPGSWLQYACKKVGPGGRVVGVDRQELDAPPPGNAAVVACNVLEVPAQRLLELAGGGCFDVVLSDMAPDTTGIAFTDQARSVELFLRAIELAAELGCAGGSFVGKVFMGEGFQEAQQQVRTLYARTKNVKPEATRRASSELYVVGTGKR
jgi:23S rRNA (uridine2552-2'-O)-methyltransferase